MAPTEILAEQHYQTLCRWLNPLKISVGLLRGQQSKKNREQILTQIASGDYHVMVGTHALFQEAVVFNALSLVVIDEQHRFGVHQRLALKQKGKDQVPHQLIMTATPIPRTLAMTAYADLDVSIIDELPPGRKPIQTVLVDQQRQAEVIARLQENCKAGKQVYWVCTLIEESELLQCQAAEVVCEKLRQSLPTLTIGLIHGRLKKNEQAIIMEQFKQKAIDILVATTVIEVGVDVPNASIMVIENAERLGLAQLHQLRGRIGRGSVESYCLLLYQQPLSQLARKRLHVMPESQDGFYIAQKDLEIRGPGEVLGTRQTGLITLRVADLIRDAGLIDSVKQLSQLLLSKYPHCIKPLLTRWLKNSERYAGV